MLKYPQSLMPRTAVLILGVCLSLPGFPAGRLEGLVVSIADGDTLTILDEAKVEHKIRLAGIDAPEKEQPFGMASKQQLADAAFRKRVIVEGDKIDRYGRLVGKVWIDGKDINLAQIIAGLAWHYDKYESEQPPADRTAYGTAERTARETKRGLWREPNPTPPWDWRHPPRP